MLLTMRCIQLAIISAALTVPTPIGALSHHQPEGVVIAPMQALIPPHSQLHQTAMTIPEPTHLGTVPGESGVSTVACAAAISVGLFVGILAVSLLVFTAVMVRRRNTTMKWEKLENAESAREFQNNADKPQISGSHGDEERPKNTTM